MTEITLIAQFYTFMIVTILQGGIDLLNNERAFIFR